MAFPSNPSNGDVYTRFGKTYYYNSTSGVWDVFRASSSAPAVAVYYYPVDNKRYVATSGQTTFSVAYDTTNGGFVEAYVNGVKIDSSLFTANNDTSITFSNTLVEGDIVELLGHTGVSSYSVQSGSSTTTYATIDELPLSGNDTGDQAFVSESNRLYLWNGTGWYNIALINTNPSITGGYDESYRFSIDGTPIEITLIGSDPEGLPLTWSYEVTTGSLTNGGGTTATISQADNVFTITPSTVEDYAGAFSITFKASDGINLATAVSAFTLAFTVADSKYTSLLVKGLTSGNNATFIDDSTNNFTITKNGDVTQGTFSPFSQAEGVWSNYFDGSSDWLSCSSTACTFGTNDFTMEAWVYFNAMPTADNWPTTWSDHMSIVGVGTASAADGCNLLVGSSRLAVQSSDVAYWSTAHGMTAGKWYHIAASRVGTTVYFFVDGVACGSSSFPSTAGTGAYTWIGCETGQGAYFNGYISNLRVVNGSALYLTDFTPSTKSLTAVTNTSLLTCQSNRFIDNSTNDFAITPAGNVTVSPFSLFDRQSYNPATHGGSAYFDGTGDYLSIPGTTEFAFGTGDFTIEAWVYMTAYSASIAGASIFGTVIGAKLGYSLNVGQDATSLRLISTASGSWADTLTTGSGIQLNTWTHIAMCRNGADLHIFKDGVIIGTTSSAATWNFTGTTGWVGRFYDGTNDRYFPGYISNVRVVNGTAIYTSAFNPPAIPPTAVTNTQLLLNYTNADILDYSSKNNLKLVGNTSTSAVQTKYSTRSIYFDGTGDYLQCALSDRTSLWRSDKFTIEFWGYTSAITEKVFISQVTSVSAFSMGIAGNGKPYAAVGITYGAVGENGTLSLSAPSPLQFVALTYGYYGAINTGTAPQYFDDGRITGYDTISSAFLYKTSGSQYMSNSVFGDPASGTSKTGAAVAHHGILGTNVIIANTWNHYAFVKDGSTITLYINGTQESTATYASDIGNTSTDIYVGSSFCQNTAKLQLDGYIEDLRITKGLARYTANFTPSATELLG